MRLRILLTIACVYIFTPEAVHAQDIDWSSEFQDHNKTFQEIVTEHESMWPVRPTEKGQGYKQFERFRYLYEPRLTAEGKIPTGSDVLRSWEEVKSFNQNRSMAGNWYPLGPIIDDVTSYDMIDGVGRMQCIAFHPTNSNYMISGAPAGGIWRSFDAGQTWSTNTDQLPTLGISSLAFDPVNPDIIYAGTGDRDAGDAPGMGVLKSIDGGENWEFFNTGIESLTVGCIRFQPGTGYVFIGTSGGLFKSIDGGLNWVMVSQGAANYKDFEFHPTNGQIIYATMSGRFYRTENEGADWDWVTSEIGSNARMCIAVSPLTPDVVYVLKTATYAFTGFYKSTDTGLTFTEMCDSPNIMGRSADGSSTGGQSWYDLCLEADHEVADVVYAGGIRVKKSIDGGATWTDINPNYVHVDQHEMAISPHNKDLYLCNDGGLYHYEDNYEWKDICNGLVTGQIYQLGQSNHNPNHTLTGYQDNGTMEFDGVFWRRKGGADGFECAYDFTDQHWLYNSIYYGDVYRTNTELVNQKICGLDQLGIDEEGAWNTPYFLDPYDTTANTMFVGLKNVWRSTNIKDPEKDSIHWVKISNNIVSNGTNMSEMERSLSRPGRIYVTKDTRKLYYTDNAYDDAPLWINLSNSLPGGQMPVNSIETHPNDTNIIYICFNNNVYRSSNNGEDWLSLTEDLPDVSTNTIVLDTTNAGIEALYLGTDMGVYYKDTTMNSFVPFNSGFPMSARVTELEIYYGLTQEQNRIKASTYGRGLWESDLYSTTSQAFPAVASVTPADGSTEAFGPFDVKIIFYRSLDESDVTGFDSIENDIWAENATVTNISGGPAIYTATIQPQSFGNVLLMIPNAAAIDENGITTYESDTLEMIYVPAPESFGPLGPGGVGDLSSMTFWLRADMNTELFDGYVESWQDVIGSDYSAIQNTPGEMPELVEEGINGRHALKFDGDNDMLQMTDVVPGKSISAFVMVETDSLKFNDHGWFASSRMPNGYLMHPWKNDWDYHNEVVDANGDYSGINSFYIGDASAPHIYGFVYHQDDLHQVMSTIFDDERHDQPGVNIGERSETMPINIDIGHDYGYEDERYGRGMIAEHFVYSQRLMETHITLVKNYMAAKYGVDLGPQSRYHHSEQPLEVFGIGRETNYDFHDEAQGKGILRLKSPTSLDMGDYLLIGQDEGEMVMNNNLYPFLTSRTERTWGFSETGDVGTVTIRIDMADLPVTENMGIILTSDNAFMPGSAVSFFPLLIQGPMLEAEINFPSEGVFTIGTMPTLGAENLNMAEATVFPNPANELLNVTLKNAWPQVWYINLYDISGQLARQIVCAGQKATATLGELSSGVYVMDVEIDGQVIERQKIIIHHH